MLTDPIPLVDYLVWCFATILLFILSYRYHRYLKHITSYQQIHKVVPVHVTRGSACARKSVTTSVMMTPTMTNAKTHAKTETNHERTKKETSGAEKSTNDGAHVIQVQSSHIKQQPQVHPSQHKPSISVSTHIPAVKASRIGSVSVSPSSTSSPTPDSSSTSAPAASQAHASLSVTMHYLVLAVTFLTPFRLVGWFPEFYGHDDRAYALQALGMISSTTRTAILCVAGLRITYVYLDCTFLAVTYSSTPRILRVPYIISGICIVIASCCAIGLQLKFNKRWPAGVAACMYAGLCGFAMILILVSVRLFVNQLHGRGLEMDEASRSRLVVQVSRLRRSSVYAACALSLCLFACCYLAYSALKDTESPWLQHQHWISWSDFAQVAVCLWMRWYFKPQ